MVKLELVHILLFATTFFAAWFGTGRYYADKCIKRLKKENAALRDMTKAQDSAIKKVAAANLHLCDSIKQPLKPVSIITTEIEIVKGGVKNGK